MNIWSSNTFYGPGTVVVASDNNLYRSLSKNIGLDPTVHHDIWIQEGATESASGIYNITVSGTPSDGDVVSWSASQSTWVPSTSQGGTSSQGSPIFHKFSFAFDTPNLLTGAPLYIPTPGDICLGYTISIETPWNGTTPIGDIGTYTTPGGYGWGGNISNMYNMTQGNIPIDQNDGISQWLAFYHNSSTFTPIGEFTSAEPIKAVVSQNGVSGGVDPGATQGAATLYIFITHVI